jgi:hypothetical protein
MTHTPTPWKLNRFKDCITVKEENCILAEKPHGIGDAVNRWGANAEFIVHAVNCHDELVEALKKIVSGKLTGYGVRMLAEKTLAKAEGR